MSQEAYINHQLNISASKQSHRFGKANRFPKSSKKTQAFYNLPSYTTKRTTTFGYGNKTDLVEQKSSPPPGSYNAVSDFEKKDYKNTATIYEGRQKVTFGSFILQALKRSKNLPSPDKYTVSNPHKTIGGVMGQRITTDPDLKQKRQIPGPGTYQFNAIEMGGKGNYILSSLKNYSSPRYYTSSGYSLDKLKSANKKQKRSAPKCKAYLMKMTFNKSRLGSTMYQSTAIQRLAHFQKVKEASFKTKVNQSFLDLSIEGFHSLEADDSIFLYSSRQQNQPMIYKLFRKELSVRSALQINKPQKSQSLFIEQISRMIKLLKRRQRFYAELQEHNALTPISNIEYLNKYLRQYEILTQQTNQIMQALRSFKNQTYFPCKAYIYTAYMRVSEMIDKFKTKYRAQAKTEVERYYDDLKKEFTEAYNQQSYDEKYQISQLFDILIKCQNQRITPYFPKKRNKPLSPIHHSKKILEQLKQNSQSCNDLRKKLISTQLGKSNDKLQQIINKKLAVPQLATLKRIEQRKREKAKPKVINLFKLYDILQIKPVVIEKTYCFKDQLQINMYQRNQLIREQMRKWQRKCIISRVSKKQKELRANTFYHI